MKKILLLAFVLTVVFPALSHAQDAPVRSASDKLFFGKEKGKEVLSGSDMERQQLQEQLNNTKAMLEELKKTNTLLEEQNKLLKEQLEAEPKSVVALLKGIDTLLKKHSEAGSGGSRPYGR